MMRPKKMNFLIMVGDGWADACRVGVRFSTVGVSLFLHICRAGL
jgi:hypothetical protein